MRLVLVTIALMMWAAFAPAQLLEDSFDYTVGSLLTDHGWTAIRGGTDIEVVTPSLNHSGYSIADAGNAVHIELGDQSVMRSFGSRTSGSVYFAFVINASDAPDTTSDGMMAWIGPTNTTIYNRVLSIKANKDVSNKIRFGLSGDGGSDYTGYQYDLNTTYLVVASYTFNAGASDDVIKLWIDPDLSSSEPAALLSDTLSSEPADLAEFVLTGEDSSAAPPTCTVDGVRVVTSWEELGADATLIFADDFETNGTTNWSSVMN